jgi:uncharacterized membrane protein
MIVDGGGAAAMTPAVRAMAGVGAVMALVFALIVAGPFRALQARVVAADWPAAGAAMATVRKLVLLNLVLGIVAMACAVLLR